MKKRIRKVLDEGSLYNTSLFRLYFIPSTDYKIGFIAKHTIGKPTKRNFIKRVIREYWRKKFQKGNYVFVLKPTIINIDGLTEALKKVAEKIG